MKMLRKLVVAAGILAVPVLFVAFWIFFSKDPEKDDVTYFTITIACCVSIIVAAIRVILTYGRGSES